MLDAVTILLIIYISCFVVDALLLAIFDDLPMLVYRLMLTVPVILLCAILILLGVDFVSQRVTVIPERLM